MGNGLDAIPYSTALVALSTVAAVLWTGGLIVLQLRRSSGQLQRPEHDVINAGMACAAFGFLTPVMGLVVKDVNGLRGLAIGLAVLYLILTAENIRNAVRAMLTSDDMGVTAALGYLAPTIGLGLIAVWPSNQTIVISASALTFAAYYILSGFARKFP